MSTDAVIHALSTAQGLPKTCPSWCLGGHEDSLEEGCTVETARVHMSGDLTGMLPGLVNPYTGATIREGGEGWRVELRADHGVGWHGQPYVHLEVSSSVRPNLERIELPFTPAEALEVARVLTHLAEKALLTD